MKKVLFFILLFLFSFVVEAETITYDLCGDGCTYKNYDDIITAIGNLDYNNSYEFIIEIKDGSTYYSNQSLSFYKGWATDYPIAESYITIKGVSDTMPVITTTNNYFPDTNMYHVSYENVHLKALDNMSLGKASLYYDGSYLNFKNCILSANDMVALNHYYVNFDGVEVNSSYLAFYYVTTKVNIINSELNIFSDISAENSNYGIRFDSDQYSIKNSKITASRIYDTGYPYNVLIEDTVINGNVNSHSSFSNYKNVSVNGSVTNMGLIAYENVNITTNDEIGLLLYDASGVVNNLNIKSLTYGIKYITKNFENNYNLLVNNSYLSNSKYSIYLETMFTCDVGCEDGLNTPSYVIPEIFMYGDIPINVFVKNSTISSLVTTDTDKRGVGNIYLEDNTTLINGVSRGSDLLKNTIIEKDDGKIIVNLKNSDVLKLNECFDANLTKYFSDLSDDGAVLGVWEISDNTILNIENGKIIPLKVGTTTITAFINNSFYTLDIEVTEDILSPETSSFEYLYIIFLIIGCIICFIYNYRKVKLFS